MKLETKEDTEINKLYFDIKEMVEQSRSKVYVNVNMELDSLYQFHINIYISI